MIFKMWDNRLIEGDTPEQLVRCMSSYKLTRPRSQARYRRSTAKSIREAYGLEVDPTTAETFISDMLAVELMVPAKENQ